MKQLIILFIFGIFISTSCKKQEPLKSDNETEIVVEEIELYGKWILVGGQMYVEENGVKTVYEHFSPSKTVSSLRIDGQIFDFEIIELNRTIWEFKRSDVNLEYGEFILNNDYYNPYGLNITNNNWTIIEHPDSNIPSKLGGSSRPISAEIFNYEDKIVTFFVQEMISGDKKYFNALQFKKL